MCEVEVSEVSVDEFTSDMVGPYEHYEIDHQYEEVTCETEELTCLPYLEHEEVIEEGVPLPLNSVYDVTLENEIYIDQPVTTPEK